MGVDKSKVNFDTTDKDNFCAQMNEQAYNAALKAVGDSSRARFEKYGQKMTFAEDVSRAGGPFWI